MSYPYKSGQLISINGNEKQVLPVCCISVVQVGKVLHEDITFPKKTEVLPDWITESANQVTLSKDNFEGNFFSVNILCIHPCPF